MGFWCFLAELNTFIRISQTVFCAKLVIQNVGMLKIKLIFLKLFLENDRLIKYKKRKRSERMKHDKNYSFLTIELIFLVLLFLFTSLFLLMYSMDTFSIREEKQKEIEINELKRREDTQLSKEANRDFTKILGHIYYLR
ncbi:hypothetical protein C6P50_06395 [Enterococcus mundtii]|nr:hypothetical protein C6P50_06395 [Enterococcus mundtii]